MTERGSDDRSGYRLFSGEDGRVTPPDGPLVPLRIYCDGCGATSGPGENPWFHACEAVPVGQLWLEAVPR